MWNKILIVLFVLVILGNFVPIIPFYAKAGFHHGGGEFCGIVYQPSCDQKKIGFFTWSDINMIVKAGY